MSLMFRTRSRNYSETRLRYNMMPTGRCGRIHFAFCYAHTETPVYMHASAGHGNAIDINWQSVDRDVCVATPARADCFCSQRIRRSGRNLCTSCRRTRSRTGIIRWCPRCLATNPHAFRVALVDPRFPCLRITSIRGGHMLLQDTPT